MAIPVYTEKNADDFLQGRKVDGSMMSTGLIPRDYSVDPEGCRSYAPVTDIQPFDEQEIRERIKEGHAKKMFLSYWWDIGDFGRPIKSLDQNGQGYCWAYSVVGAIMAIRAALGLPHVRLSAHAIGCMVKQFRDEGGWCTLSLDYIVKHGVPSVVFWPEKSMSRSNDKPETWENAKNHIVLEWRELPSNISKEQKKLLILTYLCLCIPVVTDRMRWAHSTFCLDPMIQPNGNLASKDQNSWTDNWGERGKFICEEDMMVYDGAVVPYVVVPSVEAA